MHRWIRIGLIVALFVSVVAWAGGAHGVAAQGTVYTDTMDASSTPLMSTTSSDPTRYTFSYQNGQFVIQTLQTDYFGDLVAFASVPDLVDSSVAVDFAIGGGLTGKYAFVGCRAADLNSGYQMEVHPDTGLVNLSRIDPQNVTSIASVTSPAVTIGNGNNRMEIRCVGSTITGVVNGQQVVTAQDATYASGRSFIGAGKSADPADLMVAGFDNLTITDLAGGAVVQPTQAPVQPTQAPAQPTQAPVQPTQAAGFPTAIPAQPTTAAQPTSAAQPTVAGAEPMRPITDPRVNADDTLSDAFIVSVFEDPVSGPKDITDNLPTGTFKTLISSGVTLSDFYTELDYITPPAAPAGSWAVGFTFWDDGQGNSYDMFIQAANGTAKWGFGQATNGSYTILQSGDLAAGAVDFTPGASNFLAIAVYQGIVMLSGNDFALDATVDLGASTGSGDVTAEAGFLATDTTTTQTLPVALSGFSVWDLSSGMVLDLELDTTPTAEPTQAAGLPTAVPAQPTQAAPPTQAAQPTPVTQPTQAALPTVAPPPTQAAAPTVAPPLVSPTATTGTSTGTNSLLQQIFDSEKSVAMSAAPLFSSASGTLTQTLDTFSVVTAGVSVTDVYATATFVNPTDMSVASDFGIGIRDLNNNTEFRYEVSTDGTWTLAVGSSAPMANGTVANVNAAPGASNTIEIIAKGATGILAVNGQVIQQVDLSGNLNAGDVYIGSGMVDSATIDQRQVPYSNFAVYQLTA